jgi:hypothetical protein
VGPAGLDAQTLPLDAQGLESGARVLGVECQQQRRQGGVQREDWDGGCSVIFPYSISTPLSALALSLQAWAVSLPCLDDRG